jgi:hypothetical protein
MTNSPKPRSSPGGSIELAIVAHSVAKLGSLELAALRQHSIERFSARLRPQLLKHSDDQTLAAVAALAGAIGELESLGHGEGFADWAIVSSTRYLGRAAFAGVIDKYQIDGPWGVSVQVIPHTSPHAIASTLSLALDSHGPCLGAGAAPGEEAQALLSAATLLQRPEVAGVWVVFSGESPHQSADVSDGSCSAGVLGVVNGPSPDIEPNRVIGRISIDLSRRSSATASTLATPSLSDWFVNRPSDQPATHCLSLAGAAMTIEFFEEKMVAGGRADSVSPVENSWGHAIGSATSHRGCLDLGHLKYKPL